MTPFMLRIAELVGTEPDGLTEADLARSSRGQDPPGGGVRTPRGAHRCPARRDAVVD